MDCSQRCHHHINSWPGPSGSSPGSSSAATPVPVGARSGDELSDDLIEAVVPAMPAEPASLMPTAGAPPAGV
eukprot:6484095-Amphidinium_carterae.1